MDEMFSMINLTAMAAMLVVLLMSGMNGWVMVRFSPVLTTIIVAMSVFTTFIIVPTFWVGLVMLFVLLTLTNVLGVVFQLYSTHNGVSEYWQWFWGDSSPTANNDRAFVVLQLTFAVLCSLLVHFGGTVVHYREQATATIEEVFKSNVPHIETSYLERTKEQMLKDVWCKAKPHEPTCIPTTQERKPKEWSVDENPWFPLPLFAFTVVAIFLSLSYVIIAMREEIMDTLAEQSTRIGEGVERIAEFGSSTATNLARAGQGLSGEAESALNRRMNLNLFIDVLSNLFLHRVHSR